jgi:hypothetical protein
MGGGPGPKRLRPPAQTVGPRFGIAPMFAAMSQRQLKRLAGARVLLCPAREFEAYRSPHAFAIAVCSHGQNSRVSAAASGLDHLTSAQRPRMFSAGSRGDTALISIGCASAVKADSDRPRRIPAGCFRRPSQLPNSRLAERPRRRLRASTFSPPSKGTHHVSLKALKCVRVSGKGNRIRAAHIATLKKVAVSEAPYDFIDAFADLSSRHNSVPEPEADGTLASSCIERRALGRIERCRIHNGDQSAKQFAAEHWSYPEENAPCACRTCQQVFLAPHSRRQETPNMAARPHRAPTKPRSAHEKPAPEIAHRWPTSALPVKALAATLAATAPRSTITFAPLRGFRSMSG